MIQIHEPSPFPVVLHDELHTAAGLGQGFLLRAVLVQDVIKKELVLMAAVLRPVGESSNCIEWRYPNALLASEVLDLNAAVDFMKTVAAGEIRIAQTAVKFTPPTGCQINRVPVDNYWMQQAGNVYVVSVQQVNIPQQEPLVARGAPYYPDAYEAARDWLGLAEYHGSSDSSHGHLLVLIPETRAYVEAAEWSESTLVLAIGGTMANESGFSVVGAYWVGKKIHQLVADINGGRAQLPVPLEADRLELHVVGSHGEVLDSHHDDINFPRRGMRILSKRREQVAQDSDLKQIYAGEGVRTEFKEWLELNDEKMPTGEKDKLAEVLRTVAAFANTEGGTIYFGVSNAIEIVGTRGAVDRWAKGKLDATAAVEGYMGALRATVLDFIYPQVTLRTRAMDHRGK